MIWSFNRNYVMWIQQKLSTHNPLANSFENRRSVLDPYLICTRKVWRYQRGNQKSYIEWQTIQWPKKKDKQWSTKHYTENYRSSNKNSPRCSGRVRSSWSICGTRRFTLVTNQLIVINEKITRLWLRQTEHIRGHLWHRYSVTVDNVMFASVKLSEWRLSNGSDQLNDTYSIYSCCWHVATYKSKVHNGNIGIISFVVSCRS